MFWAKYIGLNGLDEEDMFEFGVSLLQSFVKNGELKLAESVLTGLQELLVRMQSRERENGRVPSN